MSEERSKRSEFVELMAYIAAAMDMYDITPAAIKHAVANELAWMSQKEE